MVISTAAVLYSFLQKVKSPNGDFALWKWVKMRIQCGRRNHGRIISAISHICWQPFLHQLTTCHPERSRADRFLARPTHASDISPQSENKLSINNINHHYKISTRSVSSHLFPYPIYPCCCDDFCGLVESASTNLLHSGYAHDSCPGNCVNRGKLRCVHWSIESPFRFVQNPQQEIQSIRR